MRNLLYLIFLLGSASSFGAYNLTLSVGGGGASSEEMRDQKLKSYGLIQTIKFGVIPGDISFRSFSEYGVSLSKKSFKGNTRHDSEKIEISTDISVLEFYYTLYMKKYYFEFGYSRSFIENSVKGDLTNSQQIAVENIYNIKGDGENSDALRFTIGYKLFSNESFITSVAGSQVVHQGTSYRETLLALELKFLFE